MARGKTRQKIESDSAEDTGKSKIEVFTSPTCPHCPTALRLAKEVESERDDVKVIETSTGTQQGHRRAEQFNIMTVPTVFVKGPKHDIIGFRGPPMKKELLHAIDISLGLSKLPEKKQGFLSRIFG